MFSTQTIAKIHSLPSAYQEKPSPLGSCQQWLATIIREQGQYKTAQGVGAPGHEFSYDYICAVKLRKDFIGPNAMSIAFSTH